MNKIRILTIIILFVGFLIPCQTVFADDDDFDTNISISENEETDCYDIDIEVYNEGKNFTGRMELQIGDYSYNSGNLIYAAAVSAPEKSTKVVRFSVPRSITQDYSFNVSIVIRAQNDKIVHSNTFTSPLKTANSYFNVGILSNNPDALSYLDLSGEKVWIKSGEFSIKHNVLKASDLANEIHNMKIIIINDFDTSTLTKDEINILQNYVKGGGVIILGTGDNLNSLKGFDSDFTDVEGSLGQHSLTLSYSSNNDIIVTAQELDVNYNGYSLYTNYGDNGYVYRYNEGAVATMYMNLADKNMQLMSKDDTVGFVASLYDAVIANTNYLTDKGELLFDGGYGSVEEYLNKPASGSIGFIIPIILIYIVLIGPGLYLILKKIDKREKCWYIIPAVSLAFTFLIFLLSISVAIKKMDMKTITIRKANSTNVVTYVTGYSPKAKEWNIGFDEKYFTACTTSRYTWSYDSGKTYVANSASGVNLTYYPDSSFDEMSFVAYGKDDKVGGFDGLESIKDGNALTGQITNSTGMNLDYIAIFYAGKMTLISGANNGETVDIKSKTVLTDYQNGSDLRKEINSEYYKKGNYDKSSELAALYITVMAAVYNPIKDYSVRPIIVGITKSENILDLNGGEETSYTCVYMD